MANIRNRKTQCFYYIAQNTEQKPNCKTCPRHLRSIIYISGIVTNVLISVLDNTSSKGRKAHCYRRYQTHNITIISYKSSTTDKCKSGLTAILEASNMQEHIVKAADWVTVAREWLQCEILRLCSAFYTGFY